MSVLVLSPEIISKFITYCDEKIANDKDKLVYFEMYEKVLSIDKEEMETECKNKKQSYEISIKLLQTEKLIYKNLININSNNEIFSKLLSKYDELANLLCDLLRIMVVDGLLTEGYYLERCNHLLLKREWMKKLCSCGEKR